MSTINIKAWNVTKFEGSEMVIKVNFTSPIHISPLEIQDKLVIHFKNITSHGFLRSKELKTHLNTTTLKYKIKK